MSEVLLSRPDLSLWKPTARFASGEPRSDRAVAPIAPETLPAVRPGQLWYVELPSTEAAVAPLEYQTLTTANVVIYERVLERAVAGLLPLGAYAEPAPPCDWGIDRSLSFVREGWSVARLVDPTGERSHLIRQLSERLLDIPASDTVAVAIYANSDGNYREIQTKLDALGDIIDASFHQSVTLTIIFSGIGLGITPRFVVASANGLAG